MPTTTTMTMPPDTLTGADKFTSHENHYHGPMTAITDGEVGSAG